MEKISNLNENQKEELKYLKEGTQTKITPQVIEIAKEIDGTFEEKLKGINKFIRSLKFDRSNKKNIFRKRTASEIIDDEYVTGCSDNGLVFLALARALNIPAKYIETIDKDFLNKTEHDSIKTYNGHIYAGVFEQNKGWRVVDPTTDNTFADIEKDRRIIFKEGLDSWDIGITDFETLKKEFDKFKESFKEDYFQK